MIRALLPGKREFRDRTRPPQSPNTRLIGTAIAATSKRQRIAARASGSSNAVEKGAEPFAEGFDEDDDQRRKKKEGEKQHRGRNER